MKKHILSILIGFAVLFGIFEYSYAALHSRDGGMVYDDDFNITWLQDANYAGTTMTWNQAMTWADTLTYGGHSDWRLPTAFNTDGSGPCGGFNCTDSEMGHLYYNELGGTIGTSILDSLDPDLLRFNNIQSDFVDNRYWSSTSTNLGPWYFQMYGGYQAYIDENNTYSAWAVHDGDIAAVPEPTTILLFGFGLAGLVTYKRKTNI